MHGLSSNVFTPEKKTQLLSSCSPHILLIASSLWLIPSIPLKAMEEENSIEQRPSLSLGKEKDREKNNENLQSFYERDAQHPLTQEFWKGHDLSERLVQLKGHIDIIKDSIIDRTANLTNIIKDNLQQYKEILQCPQCNSAATVYDLKDIHLDEQHLVPFADRAHSQSPAGWTKANVIVFPFRDEASREQDASKARSNLIAIKKFDDIEAGLKELFESLIALELNPAPDELKMARIYDAVICPHKSLSIIMEAVGIKDIHTFLSEDKSIDAADSIDAVKACAAYLANFHIKNHLQMNQSINKKTYLDYVAGFFKTLLQNPLKEEHESFKLLSFSPTEGLSESEYVQSNNIVSLLLQHEQESFERLVTVVCNVFKENAENIFRSLGEEMKLDSSVLTRTHGDAHAHNFFYDPSPAVEASSEITPDSPLCMSMIDYASILRTALPVGHPEEDVGRFLAALWNWRAIVEGHTDEEASRLQNEFLNRYLDIVRQSRIIKEPFQGSFERAFKLNCSFYKLRYYRVLFNAQKDKKNLENDREIKKILLRSWIQENTDLEAEGILPSYSLQKMYTQKSKKDFWGEPICEKKDIKHWLPHDSEEFIDRTGEGFEESCLESIWKAFHTPKNQTVAQTTTLHPFSNAVIITGTGGVGKTSETLHYGHEALKNNAYDLIYFLHAGAEASLFKSYRNLLGHVGRSPKDKDNESLIKDLQKYVQSKKCLLIYDNVPKCYEKGAQFVPATEFLKDKIPQNAHILMSSQCNEGWEEQGGKLVKLGVFHRKESIDYLMNLTGLQSEDEKIAGDLAQELGDLPLALSHAAHSIKLIGGNNVSWDTFNAYLEGLKEIPIEYLEGNRNSLVNPDPEITYAHLIARTLRMAEKYLSQLGKQHIAELAQKLLGYSAYLDPDSLAEELFPEYETRSEDIKEALQLLSSLSLIKEIKSQSLFSMHRLEQLVIRNEQEKKKNGEAILKDFLVSWCILYNNIFIKKNNEKYLDVFVLYNLLNNWRLHGGHLGSHIKKLGHTKGETEPLSLKVYADALTMKLKRSERESFLILCKHSDEQKKLEAVRKELSLNEKTDQKANAIVKSLIKKEYFRDVVDELKKIKSKFNKDVFENTLLYSKEFITETMDGRQCASIIETLAELMNTTSQDNKFTCENVLLYAKKLITENMDGDQRASIIAGLSKAMNSLPNPESDLDEISDIVDFTEILINDNTKDIESIISTTAFLEKEERENIVRHTKIYLEDCTDGSLYSQVMERLKKFKQEERTEIIFYAKELSSVLFIKEVRSFVSLYMLALDKIATAECTKQRERIVKNAQERITSGMGDFSVRLLLKLDTELLSLREEICPPKVRPLPRQTNKHTISHIAYKNIINKNMSKKDKKAIKDALSQIKEEEQEDIGKIFQERINKNMTDSEYENVPHVIRALSEIHKDERHDIIKLIHNLKTDMIYGEYSDIINSLRKIDKNDREDVVKLVQKLMNKNMSGYERAEIIESFAAKEFLKIGDEKERKKKRKNVFKEVKALVSKYEHMDGEEIASIIETLSKIKRKEKMRDVASHIKLFMTTNINGYECAEIIEELRKVKVERRLQVLFYAKTLLSDYFINMYGFQLLEKNPTPESMNVLKPRTLYLYLEEDELFFIDKYNRQKIEINMEDRKVLAFIDSGTFERLKKSVEENILPDDEDKIALFNYTSYMNYTRRRDELTHLIQSLGDLKEEEIENVVALSLLLAADVKEGKFIISSIIKEMSSGKLYSVKKEEREDFVYHMKKIIQDRNIDIYECIRTIEILSKLSCEERFKVSEAIEMMNSDLTKEQVEPINLLIRNTPCDELIKMVKDTIRLF